MLWILLVAVLVHASVTRRHHHLHELPATTEPVDGQLEKIVVRDSVTGIQYNPYSKHHPGRHVCTTKQNVSVPVKTKETYCKPVYKKYIERCNNNQFCTGVRLIYETAYRDVVTTTITSHITYICCPGWSQVNNRSHGCNKPRCSTKCQNGGRCSKPDVCTCMKGFVGRYCERDVNECKAYKPCDQICHNTFGSYKCECRENFLLQSDGQSCRRKDGDGPAFEAKDLEFELFDKRLFKLETLLTDGQTNVTTTPISEVQKMTHKIENISKDVSSLKNKLKEMEIFTNDIIILKTKLNQLEKKASKIDDILIKYNKIKTCVTSNKICL